MKQINNDHRLLDRWQLAVVLGSLYIFSFFYFKKSKCVLTLLLEANR